MRLEPLTAGVAARLLARRARRDREAEAVAARIVHDVWRRGDGAVCRWTARLDGVRLEPREFWVPEPELERAVRGLERPVRRAIAHAARNITRVARWQLPRPSELRVEPGVRLAQLWRPLDRVACYVPGGRFPLVSTLLMTVIPARVAGVAEIVVVCPRPAPEILAAAHLLGVRRVLRLGGAQAIAALAAGTETIPAVEKICGPGNRFVTAAKRLVSGRVGVDLLAGPTELVVIASRPAAAQAIAADLLAQAEQDPDAVSFLLTPSRELAERVLEHLRRGLAALGPGSPARQALTRSGPVYLTEDLAAAVEFANRFAPEHLSLPDGPALLPQVRAAGSVFVGRWSAQPAGDYATGSNHVLPTSGWARVRGGLSVLDFLRPISVQRLNRQGLKRLAGTVVTLARAEGLPAHARAVEVRR